MTRDEILMYARTTAGLIDAPRYWSRETMANVSALAAEGKLRLEVVEYSEEDHGVRGRKLRTRAWFAVGTAAWQPFTDEEAGR